MTRISIGFTTLLLLCACAAPSHTTGGLASRQSASSGAMATAHPDNQPMTGANTINTYDALSRTGSHGTNGFMADNAKR